ncbi:hypothetical protein SAMN04489712_109202 [Thermomonospora echinospora]|uniref:Uncharacterized protein n=1 Tax=Thermomonospora echinospora TaxID=1992 RepID=A0A1H6CCM5_9ACTN|nr:hypothetical protein [Thermomonospora echinospora]SEG70770.1 hypothetical protein SAMN04489712_109202 [Thermomonospora echinospora]
MSREGSRKGLRRSLPGAGLVLVLALTAVPAAADTAEPSPADQQGAKWLCQRVDRAEQRLDKLIGVFSGGPQTRGSVAELRARADRMQERRPERAARLDKRADRREQRIGKLKQHRQGLAKAKQWCLSQGFPTHD